MREWVNCYARNSTYSKHVSRLHWRLALVKLCLTGWQVIRGRPLAPFRPLRGKTTYDAQIYTEWLNTEPAHCGNMLQSAIVVMGWV
jgi:hypothetical protein